MWLKIKIWTKIIIFGLIALYGLVFFLKNDNSVDVWYWPWKTKYTISMIWLVLIAFVLGGVVTVLVRTTLKTLRQIRELRAQNRLDRLEREQADMKAKAAMLQTRTAPTPASGSDQS